MGSGVVVVVEVVVVGQRGSVDPGTQVGGHRGSNDPGTQTKAVVVLGSAVVVGGSLVTIPVAVFSPDRSQMASHPSLQSSTSQAK